MARRFKLEAREIGLAVVLAILGFIFTTVFFLKLLATLNPLFSFLIYYVIIFGVLFTLSKMGLTLFKIEIKDFLQVIGLTLIVFSFFLIVNWENPYVQYVTMGNLEGASPVFYGSEDGMTWWAWSFVTTNIAILRWLTFVITPLILTLLGGLLVEKKIRLPV